MIHFLILALTMNVFPLAQPAPLVGEDIRGAFSKLSKKSAVVVTAYGANCPVLRQNLPEFGRLHKEYGTKNIEFLMVDGVPQDQKKDITKEFKEYGISINLEKDPDQKMLKGLGLRTVGETIVFNPSSWQVLYRGAVDDRVNFDIAKPKASRKYVRAALGALTKGEQPAYKQTKTIGCAITFLRPD